MTQQSLDYVLRDLAKRGEISHISLVPSQDGKKWRASFTMCSVFGASFAEDEDPVRAILLACTTVKLKRPRASLDIKAEAQATEPKNVAREDVEDLM